LDLNVT